MIAVILNADDLGLAPAINEGIFEAHARGCLTSASLSVAGPSAEQAARACRDFPRLGVGLHVTLVSERPLLPPRSIPSLVNGDGWLPRSALHFARLWSTGRIDPGDVRREVQAQFERAADLGVDLTHVDSHQHLHVLPGVLQIVIEAGKNAGLRAVRIPRETMTIGVGGWWRRVLRCGLNILARRAARVVRAAGFVAPDHFIGFFGAGRIDANVLLSRIAALGEDVTELSFHPASGGGLPRPDFASWDYRWDMELEALLDPRVQRALDSRGIVRMHFGDLTSARSAK